MPYELTAAATTATMTSALVAAFFLVILLVVVLIVWYKLSKDLARIAADKGYTERRWFHYCFWLGLPGLLLVCAMPDKNRR